MLGAKDKHGLRETTWQGLQTVDFLALQIRSGHRSQFRTKPQHPSSVSGCSLFGQCQASQVSSKQKWNLFLWKHTEKQCIGRVYKYMKGSEKYKQRGNIKHA